MTICEHHLSGGPLRCLRTDPHEVEHGCVYEASSAGDRHDVSEAASEETRG